MIPAPSSSGHSTAPPAVTSDPWADAVMGYWTEWREEATVVADAYALWSRSARDRAVVAFATYRAALDREEAAAAAYEHAVTLARAAA